MFNLFADAAPESISNYLFTQGILGVCVLILSGVCVMLYRQGLKKDDKIIELMDSRRLDYKDMIKEVTDVLRSNSESIRIMAEKIEVGKAMGRS